MTELNIGDVLYQLFSIGFLILLIVLIVSLFRSGKKRRNQLDRIEKKLDEIDSQMNESNS